MDLKELVELFNPANAKNLTVEQVAMMETLTKAEIQALAEAYPNKPTQPAYLILKDTSKKDNQQLYNRSTWKNLWANRKLGQKHLVAISFVAIFDEKKQAPKVAAAQDLSPDQVKNELAKQGSAAAQTLAPDGGKEEKTNTGGGNEEKTEKPLNKMNKEELQAKYKAVLNVDADPALTKNALISAIEAATEED